ncbi:hypothetical protein [Geodermatophilus sp. SYSU D00710]
MSYAGLLLILFLEPPNRWFAAWTRPDGDRRPALPAYRFRLLERALGLTGPLSPPGGPAARGG